jgi:hypothetical protein
MMLDELLWAARTRGVIDKKSDFDNDFYLETGLEKC